MSESTSSRDAALRAQRAGNTRTLLTVAAPLTALGIALAALGNPELGRWLVVVGGLALIVGLHRYGRLGADPPLEL